MEPSDGTAQGDNEDEREGNMRWSEGSDREIHKGGKEENNRMSLK